MRVRQRAPLAMAAGAATAPRPSVVRGPVPLAARNVLSKTSLRHQCLQCSVFLVILSGAGGGGSAGGGGGGQGKTSKADVLALSAKRRFGV